MNCSIPVVSYEMVDEIITKELDSYMLKNKLSLPVINITKPDIKSMHTQIRFYDDEIRTKYHANILYNNPNASIAAIEKINIVELDVRKFTNSGKWRFFIREMMRTLDKSLLLDCMKISLPYYRRVSYNKMCSYEFLYCYY